MSITADFWIDPACPWSYATARWLKEVARHRPLEVRWHVMSLPILNEHVELPEEWRQYVADSWGLHRVMVAAEQNAGQQAIGDLVESFGRRLHVDGRRDADAIIRESLVECGLPGHLADVAWVDDMDERVRLSHKQGATLGGPDVGSPILAVPGTDGSLVGFYGPIISRVPTGDDAVRLWDAYLTMAATPGFFELKRTRDEELQFA